ncbi:MAG: sigma-54 dependent transcriptional regulator [Myxococcota bacterium]|nr:sigma-54 dependent transcriptional regulator [Myxococcota bacterium]
MKTSILVVDDETAFLDSVVRMLRIEGFEHITAMDNPTNVPPLFDDQTFDIAFLDITMPEMDGLDLLKIIKERSPETECVMITANDSIPMVIQAVRRGAYDYLVKPIMPEQLIHTMDRALERRRLMESLILKSSRAVKKTLDNPEAFRDIVTGDRNMLRLLHEAELHAGSTIPILVTGDTGVGKELMARAIHAASRRASGPFVPVNMLALSPTLFESEFFGHVKGAFTGADKDKVGYLGKAHGGTLFLDEIGDLSLEIQGKLLRILQEGEYTPVGDTRSIRADVRFVAATNQDLEKQVLSRKFRKDLFYRLQFAHLRIPLLKDRAEDVPLLCERFLSGYAGARLSEEAAVALEAHDWPGNVRELKGVLEAAANLAAGGDIKPEHLRLPQRKSRISIVGATPKTGALEPLAEVERRHIISVYEATKNNKSQTARVLGIGLQTLHRKLKSFGVK